MADAVLFPVHVALLGFGLAVLHLVFGLFIAVTALDVTMLGFRTLPFASSYVGGGNLKAWLRFGLSRACWRCSSA